jgi:hypothetical protein
MANVKMRQRLEKMIARRVILDAIQAGYALNINNGGDENELPAPSMKVKEVLAAMFATDDEYLGYYKDGIQVGWVLFVHGNDGHDVVSDYTVSLEPVMKGASTLADKYA